jgi:hypothetical protein
MLYAYFLIFKSISSNHILEFLMKTFLFSSFFALTLTLNSAHAVLPAEDYLSIVAPVPNASAIRKGYYETEVNQMKKSLDVNKKDTAGYNWEVKMSSDSDSHISLVTFQRANYTDAHLEALKGMVGDTLSLPKAGYFLRPELWTLGDNPDGTPQRIHWVHPDDLTSNEKVGTLFDPSVRSLTDLNRNTPAIKEARIVFRFASKEELSKSMEKFVEDLRQEQNNVVRELNERRDDYGPKLIAHLSVARIIRAKDEKFADTQDIKNNNLVNLRDTFNGLRTSFKQKATMANPVNQSDKVIPFTLTQVDITQGVRKTREVLHTFH